MKKVCVITGASSGLGARLLQDLISLDYIILTMQRRAPLENSNVYWINSDFADMAFSWKSSLDIWIQKYGKIDLLINNAGQYIRGGANKDDEVCSTIMVNLISPIVITQTVVRSMVHGSLVVNINSVAGLYAMEFEPVYSASKHGLKGFSKSLRLQLADQGINICDLYPGGMNTELWNKNFYPGEDINNTMNPEKISKFLMFAINSPYRETFKEITLHPIQEKFV
jgi:short-subunit dehydrogenase